MNNNKKDLSGERHYSAAEIAVALCIPIRTAQHRAARESWPYTEEAVRGGKRRRYNLSEVPGDVQAALATQIVKHNGHAVLPPAPESGDRRAEALATVFEAKPESIKAKAREALAIAQEYFSLLARGFERKAVVAAITHERGISAATIWRITSATKGEPEHLWLYVLCPGYAGRTARAEMSAEAWEVLKGDYLRLERPTKAMSIRRLQRTAAEKGWILPSKKTLERRLDALPRAVQVLARRGTKALQDLYPAQQRDKSALSALAIINGDGYQHNLWVAFPDGEIIRAKTWYWQDVYSSKILGWRTDKTEHTDMIRLSFGDLVETWGIPDRVLLDNTLAAANKTMSGGIKHRFRFKVRDEEPDGVFKLLGMRITWATPGHGQAKPVERVFGIGGIGEIVDKAPEFCGAWTGGNPLDKPEYDGKTRAVPLAQLQEVIAREVAHYNAQAGRRGAIQRGRSFDEVFTESYQAAPIRRATEAQRRLWLLATEPVRAAARDGAITLDAGRAHGMANRYWANELIDHAGRQVVARFDPQRLHEGVHVYTLDGRYICFANCVHAKGFDDQHAAREHNRARRQHGKGVKIQLAAERRMDALEAAKIYANAGPGTIPAPAIARGAVVRGEFRDPLERPAPAAAADTPEEAAERAALAEELRNVVPLREEQDDWAPYRRYLAIGRRVDAGEAVSESERAWHASYAGSSECRAFALMAEDFPQKLRERAAG